MTLPQTFAAVMFALWAIVLVAAGLHGIRWLFDLAFALPWAMLAYTLGWLVVDYVRSLR